MSRLFALLIVLIALLPSGDAAAQNDDIELSIGISAAGEGATLPLSLAWPELDGAFLGVLVGGATSNIIAMPSLVVRKSRLEVALSIDTASVTLAF